MPQAFPEGEKSQATFLSRTNEGMLPPQVMPVGGCLGKTVEGWKHIMNYPYVLSIVRWGYQLCFTSSPFHVHHHLR